MVLRRMWLGGVVLVLSVAGPIAVWAGTPGVDPRNGTWTGGLLLMPGPEHLVLWNLPGSGGARGTCVDADVDGPLHGPYALARTVNDPVYGELNHLYADPSTSDVRIAELSALNSRAYDIVDRGQQWSYLVNGQGGTSVADAAAMLDRATTLAGPYTVELVLPIGVRAGPKFTATVAVTSARGAPVPGAHVTLSADGATLAATQVTTDANGQASVTFTVPAGPSVAYTVHASVQSWTSIAFYAAPGEQRMLSVAPPSTQHGQRTGTIVRDRAVAIVKAADDDPARLPVAGYTYRITDASGAVVASVTTSSTPVGLGRLKMGARYTATEIARPANGTLYIPVQSAFEFTVPDGDDTWTVLAHDPRVPLPRVSTQVSAQQVVVGAELSDVITIDGDDGEDATIDATRYGPVSPPPSGQCADITLAQYAAAPSVRVVAPVSGSASGGNGSVTITGPAVTQAGCYGWAETVTLTPSGATASSPPTAPHESTLVTKPPAPTHPPTHHAVPATHMPAARPPVHIAPPATSPPLPNTGTRFPVVRTLAVGIGLVAAGVALVWLGRRTTSTRSRSC